MSHVFANTLSVAVFRLKRLVTSKQDYSASQLQENVSVYSSVNHMTHFCESSLFLGAFSDEKVPAQAKSLFYSFKILKSTQLL